MRVLGKAVHSPQSLLCVLLCALSLFMASHAWAVVGNVVVNDVRLDPSKQLVLNWTVSSAEAPAPSSPPGPGDPTVVGRGTSCDSLNRTPTGTGFPVNIANTLTTYTDTNWSVDTAYSYYITGYTLTWNWNSTTHVWERGATPFTWPTAPVTVRKVLVSNTQTVDTRLDLRFSTVHLQNFDFATSTYRGGLFAGYNSDGSKVARTYFKFTGVTGGGSLWPAGGLYVYSPRLARSGSASLLCHKTTSATWSDAGLTWATAPSPVTSGVNPFTMNWSTGGAGQWFGINTQAEIASVAGTANPLSLVVYSSSEETVNNPPLTASSGWAYFARSNYQQNGATGYGAYLLYAVGGLGVGPGLSFSPAPVPPATYSSVTGGTSATGYVTLPYPAPASGITVTLSSNNTVATVPATVTIAGGQLYGSFTITTSAVATSTNVVISATYGTTASNTLTVTP